MSATTLGIILLCATVGVYLYVMGLCHLCDLHERKQIEKKQADEKRRKEEMQRAYEEAELKRKQEIARRRQLAEARRHKTAGAKSHGLGVPTQAATAK
ncbi:MAG: hypothetical protein Kow0099_28750 [Candidatus Abyssubacteria bacterium]